LEPTSAEPIDFFGAKFSRDGAVLALPPQCGSALMNWQTSELVGRLAHVDPGETQSRDGKQLAKRAPDGSILLLDGQTRKELRKLDGASECITSMVFSGDGRRLCSFSQDNIFRIWDLADGRLVAQMKQPPIKTDQVIAFAFMEKLAISHDGHVLALALPDSTFDLEKGRQVATVFATWDVESQKPLARFAWPGESVGAFALSPNGRFVVASSSADYTLPHHPMERAVKVWDAATGHLLHSLPGHLDHFERTHQGSACDISPDSRLLVTGDGLGRLRLWEMASGQEVHHFEGHCTPVSASFSPDGKLLVATSEEAPCYIWDVAGTTGSPHQANAAELEKAWADLADQNGKLAFQAACLLAATRGPAIDLIRQKIKLAMTDDLAQAEKHLSNLEAREPAREMATAELLKLADRVAPRLRAARANASPEVRRLVDGILARDAAPSLERLRQDRALMALEWIATPEAARALAEIAGDKHGPLTFAAEAARAGLNRQEKRQALR
jgi:WD domain, G-beta repeat